MKIVIFSYVFWPENFLVNELADELAGRGYDVSVQTSLPNYQTGELVKRPFFEKFNKVNIYRYPVIPRKKTFVFLALNYLSNIVVGLLNLVRLPRSDVYFLFATSPLIHFIPVVLLKKITKKPIVIWYQDLWPESFFAVTKKNPHSMLGRFLEVVVRWIYNNTDLMLLQSPLFQKNLNRLGYKGAIDVVYNWAPAMSKTSEKPVWLSELPTDKFIVVFAGNIGRVQAIKEIILAAKELQDKDPSIHFVLAGDGSYLSEAKTLADSFKLKNVQFVGRKPLSDMPALFERSQALIVSLNDDPALNLVIPSKLQAYMSSGKPIVGFLNGAGAEIIEASSCGVVARAQNVTDFSEKILQLRQKSEQERLKLGQNALEFFNAHFEKSKGVAKVEQHLKALCKS